MNNEHFPKIMLGTAQFGMPYGISNTNPVPDLTALNEILSIYKELGGDALDTSPSYGNAELALGQVRNLAQDFDITTKTLPLPTDDVNSNDVAFVDCAVRNSLINLGVSRVRGLLVHEASDLMQPNSGRLFDQLLKIKEEGLAAKIGVSVYNSEQIDIITSRFPIDIIQPPTNILDQRLIKSGHLEHLKKRGIEIHLRSAFLQGALLMDTAKLPSHLQVGRKYFNGVHDLARSNGLSSLQVALCFIKGVQEADYVILGVSTARELYETLSYYTAAKSLEESSLACSNLDIIEPYRWRV